MDLFAFGQMLLLILSEDNYYDGRISLSLGLPLHLFAFGQVLVLILSKDKILTIAESKPISAYC